MKKLSKIFAVVLCLAMALSMMAMGASAAADTVTFTFDNFEEASTTKYDTNTAKEALDAAASASGYLTAVTVADYIYPGHTDSNDSASVVDTVVQCLKFGKSKNGGKLEMTFSKKAVKVEILAHEYHLYSDNFGADTVAVNNSTPKAAPYTTDATFSTMTFELETASDTVSIVTSERVLVKAITVTFEGTAGSDATEGTTATEGTAATEGTGDSDKMADTTTIVPMMAVLAVAVTGLVALVIGNKKRMF